MDRRHGDFRQRRREDRFKGKIRTGIRTVKIAGTGDFLVRFGLNLGPKVRFEVEFVHVRDHFAQ